MEAGGHHLPKDTYLVTSIQGLNRIWLKKEEKIGFGSGPFLARSSTENSQNAVFSDAGWIQSREANWPGGKLENRAE